MAWLYYQTKEDSRQSWIALPEERREEIDGKAYHASIYTLDKTPDETEPEKIRYSGDFWIDIDHKPSETVSEDEALNHAIDDLTRLVKFLEASQVALADLEFFATGSKGFHVRIPAAVFGGTGRYKGLPLIHRQMAYHIAQEASLEGLDGQLYCTGKGRLIRQPNMRRANGCYKVPILLDALKGMNLETYRSLVSMPRTEGFLPEGHRPARNEFLSNLFVEARQDTKDSLSAPARPVGEEAMAKITTIPPKCVQWLASHTHIRQKDGKFNGAKMGLARYLGALGEGPYSRHTLIDQFAESWSSDRHPTEAARAKELRYAIKYGREQGFSCAKVLLSLAENPCPGCPVLAESYKELSASQHVVETETGYYRPATKGRPAMELANFTMRPLVVYTGEKKGVEVGHLMAIFKDQEPEGGKPDHIRYFDKEDFGTAARFRAVVNDYAGLRWMASDSDLQAVRAYLTDKSVTQGVKKMAITKTVGVYRHIDPDRDIDEYVWVQEDWSINAAGVADTVRFGGPKQENNGRLSGVTLDFKKISDQHTDETCDAFLKLMEVNHPHIVAVTAGWNAACWLKQHIIQGKTELHFPLLELCGAATAGKTLTAKLFSILAGANYLSKGVMTTSTTTPFVFKAEVAKTTTVPRIFDEVNPHKMPNRFRFIEVVEVLKAAASGGLLSQGFIRPGHRGADIEERQALAPLVFMGTQPSTIKEIVERAVTLLLSAQTRAGRMIGPVEKSLKHLYPLSKQMMQAALVVSDAWVEAAMDEAEADLPKECEDRLLRNYQTILTGLKFLYKVLQERGYPAEVLDRAGRLQQDVIDYVRSQVLVVRSETTQQEIDVIFDMMGEMCLSTGRGEPRLARGIEYTVEGGTLHLNGVLCFSAYLMYCAELRRTPELQDYSQLVSLTRQQPYFIGTGLATTQPVPEDWLSLSLEGLRIRGVRVARFGE